MRHSGVLASFGLIWTITAGATLIQVANGLLQILLPLRMEAAAIPISGIGWVASAYGLGFAVGCLAAPALVRHVGYIRAFSSMAAIACVVVLSFTRAEALWEWIVLRILSGLALAGLFTIIDGWVSARATTGNRGRVVSLYMICTKIALMLSPLAIGLGSIERDGLFMLVAALMCLSLLPVSATISEEPRAPRSVRIIVPQLFRIAPSAIVGAFAVGLMNGAVIAITPVYGVRLGLAPEAAALLVLAVQAGSLLFQWPLGWLSDMTDRRKVIAGLAAGTALACGAVVWASAGTNPTILLLAFGFWGGMALCVYAVCVAHACDLVEPDQIVPAISSLLVCWAFGSMIGPAPATFLMEAVGPQGLFYYCGTIALALFGFVLARIFKRDRPKSAGGFVNMPATSAAVSDLSPRAEPEDEPAVGPRDPDRP
ncbi:MAG: MFS transporter [Salinarimonadaceae bacterium]|nr:MAG: MFS transporter [Salinarimonadaceae bacterium]